MTPAERTAKVAELRAEADRLEREGKRNWPETVEIGMIFRHDDGEVYIASRAAEDALTRYQSPDCLVCVSGAYPGFGVMYAEPNNCSPFDGDESDFTYLGHACDLLTIKTPDEEPTGAELVGKVCQLSRLPINTNRDGIRDTVVMYDAQRDEYHGAGGQCKPWKYARIYREGRP